MTLKVIAGVQNLSESNILEFIAAVWYYDNYYLTVLTQLKDY